MSGRAGGAITYPSPAFQGLPALLPAEPDFVIGVIDTGVVADGGSAHPFLQGHLTSDWLQNLDTDGGLDHGHGTFVAGLILQQAPTATIRMSNALLGRPGTLDDPAAKQNNDEQVAQAIRDMAAEDHLAVLNLSFLGDEETAPEGLRDALDFLFHEKPDLVVIAAAGNSWTDDRRYPAGFSFDRLKAIGATDETSVLVQRSLALGRSPSLTPPLASFSNYGQFVHGYASGVDLTGPCRWYDQDAVDFQAQAAGWCRWSGTSFAAARVAGRLARTRRELSGTGPEAWGHLMRTSSRVVPSRADSSTWQPWIDTRPDLPEGLDA